MKFTTISGNGTFALMSGLSTNSQEVTIYAPPTMSANVVINYLNEDGVAVPYLDGDIFSGEQKRIRCGIGVKIVAVVTALTAPFTMGYAG